MGGIDVELFVSIKHPTTRPALLHTKTMLPRTSRYNPPPPTPPLSLSTGLKFYVSPFQQLDRRLVSSRRVLSFHHRLPVRFQRHSRIGSPAAPQPPHPEGIGSRLNGLGTCNGHPPSRADALWHREDVLVRSQRSGGSCAEVGVRDVADIGQKG